MTPARTCVTAVIVSIRTAHRMGMNRSINVPSASTRDVADAAHTAPTMNVQAAHEIVAMFPRVPEKRIDHVIPAPKNEMALRVRRFALR